jgi:hypothetical protein
MALPPIRKGAIGQAASVPASPASRFVADSPLEGGSHERTPYPNPNSLLGGKIQGIPVFGRKWDQTKINRRACLPPYVRRCWHPLAQA